MTIEKHEETIEKHEEENERTREGRNGRIYVSTSTVRHWLVRDGAGEVIGDFARLRDARTAHPAAKVNAK